MLRYLLPILFLFIFVGCNSSKEKPQKLIPEQRYITLLVELQLIRSYSEVVPPDSVSADSLMQQVFRRYNISSQAFKESHRYYQQFPEQQKERINKAIEILKKDQVGRGEARGAPTDSLK